MILFFIAVFLYLFTGWVVSYEAHKRDWNSQLAHWDQASHLGWWLGWPWYGLLILGKGTAGYGGRFHEWTQNLLGSLFNRMTEFNWRHNGTEDESTEGS